MEQPGRSGRVGIPINDTRLLVRAALVRAAIAGRMYGSHACWVGLVAAHAVEWLLTAPTDVGQSQLWQLGHRGVASHVGHER